MDLFKFFKELDEKKLIEWIKNPIASELWDYDFKEALPHKNDTENKRHLIATFCAFANTRGGFLVYGIDKNRNIKGLPQDDEFRKKINDLVGEYIRPPLPFKNWGLINQFELVSKNPGKYIYIIRIIESPFYLKPHICAYNKDNRIYIRQNSSNKTISDGQELRRLFFQDVFSPYCHENIEYVLRRITRINYEPSSLESNFIFQLLKYLENKRREDSSFANLLNLLETIIKKRDKLKKRLKSGGGEGLSIMTENNLVEKAKELETLTSEFLERHKGTHGIKDA